MEFVRIFFVFLLTKIDSENRNPISAPKGITEKIKIEKCQILD